MRVPSAVSGDAIQLWPWMPKTASTELARPSSPNTCSPEERDRDAAAQQRGQVEDRAVDGESADPLVQHERERQREDELERHAEDHIRASDDDAVQEPAIPGEHVDVVVEAGPDRIGDEAVVGERQEQRVQHRSDRDDEQPDEPRQEEEVSGAVLLAQERLPLDVHDRHGFR